MLLPKPVRRLLLLLITLVLGYQAYEVVKVHSRQEVIAFKRYSSALESGNSAAASNLIGDDKALQPFSKRAKRVSGIPGRVRLTWHAIQDVRTIGDGKMAVVTSRQVIRYDPVGADTLWGAESMYNTQRAILVMVNSSWKITEYQDSFYVPGLD